MKAMHRRCMLRGGVWAFAGLLGRVSARAATKTLDQAMLKVVYHLSDLEKVSRLHCSRVGAPGGAAVARLSRPAALGRPMLPGCCHEIVP